MKYSITRPPPPPLSPLYPKHLHRELPEQCSEAECVPLMGYQWKLFTGDLKKVTILLFIHLSILYLTVLPPLQSKPHTIYPGGGWWGIN